MIETLTVVVKKMYRAWKASDGWLTYDAQFYNDFFKELSGIIKKI